MRALTRANTELFRRGPDERFETLQALQAHCLQDKERSQERWTPPGELVFLPQDHRLRLKVNGDGVFNLNEWSFSQACALAGVAKDTLNQLSPETAARVFAETLPGGTKPLQTLTANESVRSIHGASYTRLYNTELLSIVQEFATDFQPPQKACAKGGEGGTGLYCGEQDMFVFLIDPTGWAEIEGEAFAPGFFLWNSEVGRRTVGIQSFWFQAVCQNHIVWDAVEVVDFSRKHTANVSEAIAEIRRIISSLVEKRDARRDGFAGVIKKAMETTVGTDSDQVLKVLSQKGITRQLAKEALQIAEEKGRFTVFALVDALTRLSARFEFAGDRTEVDQKSSALLTLAA